MKHTSIFTKAIIFIFIIHLIAIQFAVAQPIIGEDDEYIKNIKRGETDDFYWIVSSNASKDYAVSVRLEGFDDWSYEIYPESFVLSDRNPYKTVKVNVTIPSFTDKQNGKATVFFIYRELNSSIKSTITKDLQITIVGFAYRGEENTIFGGLNNPLPSPFDNPYGALLLNILIWLIIAFITYFFIKYIISGFVRKTKTNLDDAIVDIIRKPILVIIVMYGLITSIIRLGIQAGIRESLYQIYLFIVLGIIIYIVYKIYNKILEEITMRRGGDSSTFGKVLRPIFRIIGIVVIIIGGLIYALTIIGVEITAFLAGAGVFGLVIAFAAQDTLSNFFSGVHILLDRPFKMGDIILLETGEYCRIEGVGMRSTKLYSLFDHELIILPNNTIANQRIINIVRPDTKIRQKIEVGVAYGSDVEKVKRILYESALHHPNVLNEEGYEPLVRFTGFNDSSLNFLLIFTVDDVMNQWKTRSDVVTEIDKRFRTENVTIPFPQRTIWFNKVQQAKQKKKDH